MVTELAFLSGKLWFRFLLGFTSWLDKKNATGKVAKAVSRGWDSRHLSSDPTSSEGQV